MDLTVSEATSTGPVRTENEDTLGSILAGTQEEKRSRGSLLMVADGVAGSGRGGEASRLAIQTALQTFRDSDPSLQPSQRITQLINAANLAVYDAGMKERDQGRGATTLTAAVFQHDEVTIGHVGDCRAYLLQGSTIRRLTSDHSYAGTQVRMGFLTEEEAMKSPTRYQLTRALGRDPFVRIDLSTHQVTAGSFVILCSDGLHGSVTEPEIVHAVLHHAPAEACRKLVALAEKRGSDDNISVQIARIDRVERVAYYRGIPFYPPASAVTATQSEVGKVLDDRFELLSLLSEGGMAMVYRALDRKTGRTVAVKIPFLRYESDPVTFGRFQREEQILKSLDHPAILKLIPVEKKSRPYLVMEYLEGQTLTELMEQVRPLPVADALRIASSLCSALDYIHERGIVHRDLKPQNIMVCDDGSLRIMDFGIAKTPDESHLPASLSSTMGTPDYMAPEQVRKLPGDERTDLYSLGAILYEMVTGHTPYQGDNAFHVMNARLSGDPVAPRKLRPDLSPAIEEIILHAMTRSPESRYQSAIGFQSDLDHPDLVRVDGRAERLIAPKIWASHWRRIRTGVIAFLLILAVFGLLYLISHAEKGKPRPPHWGR